jgi:NAD(P)H dehydrogenase (quinone)
MSNPTLLVTGAAGQFGRQAVEHLLAAGGSRVIATTRDPAKLAGLAARGAEVRAADFDDPASLRTAFAGADRLLLISTDTLDIPGKRLAQHRAAVTAAKAAGVGHVVYTSAPAAHPIAGGGLEDDHFWTEVALYDSGLDWTILRNNLYADLLPLSLGHAIATGQLFSATAGRGRSYVTRSDAARTAAHALLKGRGRQVLDVTGPAAVTQDEVAALVSELSGRPVAHVEVPPAGLRQGMVGAGLPPFLADALVAFDVAAAQGYHAIVTPTVKDLTGEEPVPLRDFLTANRAALKAAA